MHASQLKASLYHRILLPKQKTHIGLKEGCSVALDDSYVCIIKLSMPQTKY